MEKASFKVFLATIALGIIAFLPPAWVPFMVVKTVIIAVGILVSFILYVVSRIQEKSLRLPFHPILILGGLAGLSLIASVVFSASPANSFISSNFDQYSGAFLLVVLLAGLLTTLLVTTRDRIMSVAATVIGSFSLVAIFHIVRLVLQFSPYTANLLRLGTFTSLTSTMAGSWYDLAILAGVVFLISFFCVESFYSGSLPATKRLQNIAISLCIVSFIFLILIDLSLIWIGIAVATFLFALHRFLFTRTSHTAGEGETATKKSAGFSNLPYIAIGMFIIAVFFSWKGASFSSAIIQKLNISYAEVSLPWQSTLDIASPTLKQSPLFGAGPDRFAEQYLLYKPEAINQTQFWNVTFPNGSSFILTSLVNQGLVGFMIWAILFVWFIFTGIQVMRRPHESPLTRCIVTVSFLTTLFLWCMLILYAPSQSVILVTFVMTGLFVAILSVEHGRGASGHSPKVGMFAIEGIGWKGGEKGTMKGRIAFVVLVLAALVAVAGVLIYVKDAIAQTYFQSGINSSSAGDAVSARASFEKALMFKKSDIYYQALAQVDAYEINSIISSATSASSTAVASIGSLINEGIGFARSGQVLDHANPNNFLAEGDISEIAAALSVPNAYANSKNAYIEAVNLSPRNPAIYLSLARLEYVEGSTTAAESDINAALQLKPNYTDALFEAGVISYNVKDYQTAASAFEATLKVDGTYVNAEYFLGLTFARAGDITDAITVFTALAKAYPQNATIAAILTDLQSGKSIFTDTQAQTSQPPSAVLSQSKTAKSSAKDTKQADTSDDSSSTSQ